MKQDDKRYKVWILRQQIFLSFKFSSNEIQYLPAEDIIFISQHLNGCLPDELQILLGISKDTMYDYLEKHKIKGIRERHGNFVWWVPSQEIVRALILKHNRMRVEEAAQIAGIGRETMRNYFLAKKFGPCSHTLEGYLAIHRHEERDLKTKANQIKNGNIKHANNTRGSIKKGEFSPLAIARILHVPPANIYFWIKSRWIKAIMIKGRLVITQEDFIGFIRQVLAGQIGIRSPNLAKIRRFALNIA